jgi:hypothetical protein
LKYSLDDLEKMVAFENRWDEKLCGRDTRAHRELLSFTAARILQAGATPDNVVGYLRELIAEFWTEAAPGGLS